jgi:hypothetical protein
VQSRALPGDGDASIVVVMKVHELKTEVDRRFADVDRRFDEVDRRFHELREELDRRFAETDEKIVTEGQRTRHHFDVVAEQFTSEIRAMAGTIADMQQQTDRRVLDLDSGGATLYAAVDDHELRLRVLERKRRTT